MNEEAEPDRVPDFAARADVYDALRPADDAWWARFDLFVTAGDLRGRRVLDVGCGTGRLAAALAGQASAKVWGIDPSEAMLAVAREQVPPGVGLRVGRAERLPFREGWFERVTMSLVAHLVELAPALAEARRVLVDDGRIVIGTFHPDHFDRYWLNDLFPSIAPIDRRRFPDPETLEAELGRAGFSRVELTRLTLQEEIDRAAALDRIRGRHISTFDLLDPAELAEGTERAARELPERIVTHLDQLVVVGIV